MQEQKVQNCFAQAELQQVIKQSPEQVTIIDVRSPEKYAEMHIPGAVNIPLTELEKHLNELSIQAVIITACGKGGGRSAEAAAILRDKGFSHANFLCGGTFGFFEATSIS